MFFLYVFCVTKNASWVSVRFRRYDKGRRNVLTESEVFDIVKELDNESGSERESTPVFFSHPPWVERGGEIKVPP